MSSPSSFEEISNTISQTESTFDSNRDLSGPAVLQQLADFRSKGIHYAADTNIASQCEFIFNKDIRGDMLVSKTTDSSPSEFVLSGIFEIDARNFFMTSDGKWNPNNSLRTRLEQVKPTCHLLPVQRNIDFSFSLNHFPAIINNLRAIEALANPRKTHGSSSVIVGDTLPSSAIKLTHHLFSVCHFFITSYNFSYHH